MSLILHIDTATEEAHVSIGRDGVVLKSLFNRSQKDHASFLQPAVQQLAKETGIILNDIDAVAVTAGPGSYTGIRVGMASAKGLCYSLKKPLLTLVSLEILAASALQQISVQSGDETILLCPMIDARRMEVFTAIYDTGLINIIPPSAMVLDENSFSSHLSKTRIFFFGSGSAKWAGLCKDPNASFITTSLLPEAMNLLAYKMYAAGRFAELAKSQPLYLKEFNDNTKR